MKTEDLKNLALMGIAGGMILAGSQAQAENYDEYSVAASGGTVAGCGGRSSGTRPYRTYDHSREPVRDRYHDDRNTEYRYYDGHDQRYEEENGHDGYNGAYYSPNGEIKESALTSQLNPESLRVYYTMNQEGKELVIRLSKQYSNKNEAVRQAQRMLNPPTENKSAAAPATRPVTRHSLFR
jgi:hypothetical protein